MAQTAHPELERIAAELEAEHEATERAALEQGDPELPPPLDDDEAPLPAEPPAVVLSASPAADEPGEPAEDQEGEPAELSDDEVEVLFGPEQLDPAADRVDDDDYDPRIAKPEGFR